MPQVFNKGKRTITYGVDAANDKIGPNERKNVSPEQAETIRKQWGHEVINLDSKEDMQAAFKPEEKKDRAAGYISVEEAEKQKKDAIAAALAEQAAKTAAAGGGNPPPPPPVPQTVEELAQDLDAKDRPDLIAFIEAHELPVDHKKLKKIDDLKAAVFDAYKVKKEAEAAAAGGGDETDAAKAADAAAAKTAAA